MSVLKFYKIVENAEIPAFATEGSACFDLKLCLHELSVEVQGLNLDLPGYFPVTGIVDPNNGNMYERRVFVPKNARMLVPTGLIFDIPEGYSVRLHPRSGLAFSGLTLANCEGVIDSDYVEEVKVILQNHSTMGIVLYDGCKICQGELVKNEQYELVESALKPTQKTERIGGFGSTGK